jgi:CRISPR/Cas system-associated exonuclease Cas4 (RecB family)
VSKRVVKRTPTLAAYLDALKEPSDLLNDISRHVLKRAAQPTSHRADRIYPSEVVKPFWCMRATYLRIVNGRVPETTNFRRENIFEEGNRSHEKWQQWLTEMRRLEGEWLCLACGNQFYDRGPEHCSRCHNTNIRYKELRLGAPSLMLSGRCDGYLPGDNCLIEIKTMGLGGLRYENPGFVARYEVETPKGTVVDLDRLWKEFRRPLPSAVLQGNLYLHLARFYAGLDVDRIVFIYDFKASQDVKCFTIPYNAEKAEALIGRVQEMVNAVTSRSLPPCSVSENGCRDCKPYAEAA